MRFVERAPRETAETESFRWKGIRGAKRRGGSQRRFGVCESAKHGNGHQNFGSHAVLD
jgi:hypothetical protein